MLRNKLIYIASPYSEGNQEFNVIRQINAAEILSNMGFTPSIPLLSHYWHKIHPHNYDFWINNCLITLSRCDGLLRLQGKSFGAELEINYCNCNNIPVFHTFRAVDTYFHI